MIYYLFVIIFLGFEIQKLLQFDFFFRIRSISGLYSKKILKRTNSIAFKEISKLALIDIFYIIVLLIGLFTINRYFFCGVLLISVLQSFVFKLKNKTFKKIFLIIDIILTISLLILAIINFSYYQLDGIQFIKQFFKI